MTAFAHCCALLSLAPAADGAGSGVPAAPRPLVVDLDPAATEYVHLLGGERATVTMQSGFVSLKPGETVGEHDTGDFEEAVIVLEGSGEMRLAGGATLALKPYAIAYSPPGTTHDVVNTGEVVLRYVYVVARARAAER